MIETKNEKKIGQTKNSCNPQKIRVPNHKSYLKIIGTPKKTLVM
jgi:hypothetical protein